MTLAFDAQSNLAIGTGDRNFTHTPVGTPRGVVVVVVDGVSSDQVVGVTYGGTAMIEVPLSPAIEIAGELGSVHGFFLGASIPTGAQTVAIDRGDATNYIASCFSVTAAADTEVFDTSAATANAANPSVTLTGSASAGFACGGLFSGAGTLPGITPGTNYSNGQEGDNGAEVFGTSFFSAALPTGDVTYNWTASSNDFAILGVLLNESAAGGVTGTIAQTLPALIQAATGEVLVRGTVASSLPSLIQATTGEVLIQGVVAQTLPALTQAASGDVLVSAAAASVLPALTQAAAGDVLVSGSAASVLPAFTQAAVGNAGAFVPITEGVGGLSSRSSVGGLLGTEDVSGVSSDEGRGGVSGFEGG